MLLELALAIPELVSWLGGARVVSDDGSCKRNHHRQVMPKVKVVPTWLVE
jgi:hypothetical protein